MGRALLLEEGRIAARALAAALALALLACSSAPVTVAPPPARSTPVTLLAVGDILLDRGVARQVARHGARFPLARVAGLLSSADIALGNLEGPISAEGVRVGARFAFRAPPSAAPALARAGLDLVSLANNHTMDCGRDGLLETIAHLEQRGLGACGAGRSAAEASAPLVRRVRGLRLAFVCFCDLLPEGAFLRDDRPTVAFATEEEVRRAVRVARDRAEVIVVSLHWGLELATRPGERQTALARAAIDAGADLVLGHHPHVLQGISSGTSRVTGRPFLVAYSLGNFVFDHTETLRTESAALRVSFGPRGLVGAEVIPLQIDACQPRPASAEERVAILGRLALLSEELGTRIVGGRVALRPGHSR